MTVSMRLDPPNVMWGSDGEMDLTMPDKLSRRDALRLAVASGSAPLIWQASETVAAEATGNNHIPRSITEAEQLTAYLTGGHVLLRWNNFVIGSYRACPLQKYPYLSHLAGPISGVPLTTESSLPFPHHRGVWLGCEPLNGGDYWRDGPLAEGQIRSIGLELREPTSHSAVIRNRCQWVRRGAASPFVEERMIKFRIYDDTVRLVDFDIHLKALDHIQIEKAKHSFFALRVAPDIAPIGGGTLVNAEGLEGEAGTYGKESSWCGYYGRRAGYSSIVEGITVIDHPENPWSPCAWLTRDYGHLSPSPFNFLCEPWTLPEGESIRLRYRVVIHAGDPREAGLDQIYKEWLSG